MVSDAVSGSAAAVVLAGGSGTRVGAGVNKVYLQVGGTTVVERSLRALAVPGVGPLVLVVRPEDRRAADVVLAGQGVDREVEVVTGGASRQQSELAGLRVLAGRIADGTVDVVLVHDAARPFASAALVAEVLRVARAEGGAVPGVVRHDLAVAAPNGALSGRAGALTAVQTPQGFRAEPLLRAYEQAERDGFAGTDTASCIARYAPDLPVRAIAGEARNFKITYAHDLEVAGHALGVAGAGASVRAVVSPE